MNKSKNLITLSSQFQEVVVELKNQNKNPPGGDKYISDCYGAMLKLIQDDDNTVIGIMELVLNSRPNITPQYFVNLFFRVVQYIELYEIDSNADGGSSYPARLTNQSDWEEELIYIFGSFAEELKHLLKDKNTVTTVYQRYAGPQILINTFKGNDSIVIADFGCGGNFGLPGMELGAAYDRIEDNSPDNTITSLLYPAPKIKKGLAFDVDDPHEVGAKEWRTACSFYPSEFSKLAKVLIFEEKIAKAEKTSFILSDLTEIVNGDNVYKNSVDFVIISTVLYQLTPEDREAVLDNAKYILKPSGIIVVQDFARKNNVNLTQLDFNIEWFSKNAWSYRTFMCGSTTNWEFKEVLQWSNGRCREVREGEDFQFMTSSAAFAQSPS